MEKIRTFFSKTTAFSRLNSSKFNRYSETVRPFSIQHTDLRQQNLNSFPFRDEQYFILNRCVVQHNCFRRSFASEIKSETRDLPQVDFEHYCAETLESLTDYFDELVEKFKEFEAADVMYKVMQIVIKIRLRMHYFSLTACISFYLRMEY